MPLVSVIVPCRDGARWLRETLESVLDQRLGEVEILVVDDGSRDGSAELAGSIAPAIRVLRQPPKGVSHARNAGTRAARGQFLQYLDADDVLEPGTLRERIELLERTGADVALAPFAYWELQADGTFAVARESHRRLGPRPEAELLTDAWWPPGAVLYRRAIVEGIGGWRENLPIIQDARFLLDAALCGARFAHVERVGVKYRVHAESLSRREPHAFVEDCHASAAELHDRWRSDGTLDAVRRRALAEVFAYTARASFASHRARFDDAVARLRELEPGFRPREPWTLRALSSLVGYRSAEHVALWWRRLRSASPRRGASARRPREAAGQHRA